MCVCVLDGWLVGWGGGASRALSEAPLMWKIITCVVKIISKKSRIKVNRLTVASTAAPDEPPAARRTARGSPRRRQLKLEKKSRTCVFLRARIHVFVWMCVRLAGGHLPCFGALEVELRRFYTSECVYRAQGVLLRM